MSSDGPTPQPGDQDIFKNGTIICWLSGGSNAIENYVKGIAEQTETRLDWHFFAGRGRVLHLGDEASFRRAQTAIEATKFEDLTIQRIG